MKQLLEDKFRPSTGCAFVLFSSKKISAGLSNSYLAYVSYTSIEAEAFASYTIFLHVKLVLSQRNMLLI